MLIPGSLGETRPAKNLLRLWRNASRRHMGKGDGGPIFLGAQLSGRGVPCRGYDSWFIPLERLPKPPKKPVRRAAMVSQSGAFMITRLRQNPGWIPLHASPGQPDRPHHGDLMQYFATRRNPDHRGHIEGFKDHDGLDFARAVRSGHVERQTGGGLQGRAYTRRGGRRQAPRPRRRATLTCSMPWWAMPVPSWQRIFPV